MTENTSAGSASGLTDQQRADGRLSQPDDEPDTKRQRLQLPEALAAPEILQPTESSTIREAPPTIDEPPTKQPKMSSTTSSSSTLDDTKRLKLQGLSISKVKLVRTKRGHTIDIHVNEDTAEDPRTLMPKIREALIGDMPKTKVAEGMNEEMSSMDYFDVYEPLKADQRSDQEKKEAIGTRWVLRWKGNKIRARLVVQ